MPVSQRILLTALILLVAGLALVGSGALNITLPTGCDWTDVEIEDEATGEILTFDSKNEFQNAAEARGVDFDAVFGDVTFRETSDGLEFRPDDCGVGEVPAQQ